MMYELRDCFTEVKNFILSCPFLDEFGVSIKDAFAQEHINSASITAELSYQGSRDVSFAHDITGDTLVSRCEVFHLKLLQNAISANGQTSISQFIDNFQQWVDYLCFHESGINIPNGENVTVWADSYCEQSKTTNNYWYVIQLNVSYEISYAMC